MLRLWRLALYKEPFDGPLPWVNLGVGLFSLFAGLFITFSGGLTTFIGPMLVALGLIFVFWGVSDLLPSERRSEIVLAVAGLPQLGLGF